MRGDLVYQDVINGRIIEVLRDELGRTYAVFMSRWCMGYDTTYGYRRGRSRSASEGRTGAVLEVCTVFENLGRKLLRYEYKV